MPFNGSGTFVPLASPDFPAIPNTTILSSAFNNNWNDMTANGLTKCMTRDGQSPPTANIPFAGFRPINVGAGTNDTDGAQLGQTLAVRGLLGAVDWNNKLTNGIFEATSASFTLPSLNYPATTDLGQLFVTAQGAQIAQLYVTASAIYLRQRLSAVWSAWSVVGSGGSGSGGSSYLTNGALRVWQAGTSLASGTGKRYLADMVYQNSVGSTYTSTQTAWAPGTDAPGIGAQFYLNSTVTSVTNAANYHNINLPVEDVRTLAGKQVTLSFWCQCGIAQNLAVSVLQNFGTGGSPSTAVETYMATIAGTASWTRVTATFTLPVITGKTIGTNEDSSTTLRIWTDAGANFNTQTNTLGQRSGTYNFSCFKLEDGLSASGFTLNPAVTDYNSCFRYFVRTNLGVGTSAFSWYGNTPGGGTFAERSSFPTQMRVAPVMVTIYQGDAGFSSTPSNVTSNKSGSTLFIVNTATNPNANFLFDYTADARM